MVFRGVSFPVITRPQVSIPFNSRPWHDHSVHLFIRHTLPSWHMTSIIKHMCSENRQKRIAHLMLSLKSKKNYTGLTNTKSQATSGALRPDSWKCHKISSVIIIFDHIQAFHFKISTMIVWTILYLWV